MRLIDADRFKDNIMSGLYIFCQENKEDIARAIDDEPTVEYSFYAEAYQTGYEEGKNERPTVAVNCKNCDGYEAGYSAGLKDAERPTGKWKFIQGATTKGSLKCPFCDYRDYHKINSNFCHNCGADMRGGAE